MNVPVFQVLRDFVRQAGAAGCRRSDLVDLQCLKGQPSRRRDRVLSDLSVIGHPIYCKTVENELVFHYNEDMTAETNSVSNKYSGGAAARKTKDDSTIKGKGKPKKSQPSLKRKAPKLSKKTSSVSKSKRKTSGSDSDEAASAFGTDDEGESSDDSDDDDEDDVSSDSDDSGTSSEPSTSKKSKRTLKNSKMEGVDPGATQKKRVKKKKLHWDVKEDSAVLFAFLKKIILRAEVVDESGPPFLSASQPTTYAHMVAKLLTEKDTKGAGLARSVNVCRDRVIDLLETFDTAGGMVTFVLLSSTRMTKDDRKMLHKFISLSSANKEDIQENPFTAGLRHQFSNNKDAKPSKEAVTSGEQLLQYGWLERGNGSRMALGSAFESCFQSRIAPTYKKMMGDRGETGGPAIDLCDSILQSYASSMRPGKSEVSSAEGLLAAHNVFVGARSQEFGEQCFTEVSVKLSKTEGGSFELMAPNASDTFKKSKVIGTDKETVGKTGHYDKPINRIKTTMAFGKDDNDEGNVQKNDSLSNSAAATTAQPTKKRDGSKDTATCPWVEKDGTVNNSLLNLFTSKVVEVVSLYPGASLDLIRSSLAILSLQQAESVLRSMEKDKLIRKEIPEQTVKMDGIFGERVMSGDATYYIY